MRLEPAAGARWRAGVGPRLRRILARPRHRRLLFVLALSLGLMLAMVLAPALRSPVLMALGLLVALAAVVARALSEPRFAAEAAPLVDHSVAGPHTQETV